MELDKQQLTLGKILTFSWDIFTEHFKTILLITLLVYIPIDLLLNLLPFDFSGDNYRVFSVYLRVVQLLEGLFGVLVIMGIAYLVENAIHGRTVSVGEAFKKATSRWLGSIGTNILLSLTLVILFLLLIIPGVIWTVYYTFAIYIVVLRGKSGSEALSYSKSLVFGRWWKVTRNMIVFGCIASLFPIIGGVIVGLWSDTLIANMVVDIIGDIISSFTIVAQTVLFLNLDFITYRSVQPQNNIQVEDNFAC